MNKKVLIAIIEIGTIMFLLYVNILMGFYTVNQANNQRTLLENFEQILTWQMFVIALVGSFIAYLILEFIIRSRR